MTTATDRDETRPTIALAMGDPAGVSPELTAKLLTLDEVRQAARLIVIGDRRVFDAGARIAGAEAGLRTVAPDEPMPDTAEPIFVDLGHLDPATVQRGAATREGGRFALTNFTHALRMAVRAEADAVCFTPFNKQAMRLAHPP